MITGTALRKSLYIKDIPVMKKRYWESSIIIWNVTMKYLIKEHTLDKSLLLVGRPPQSVEHSLIESIEAAVDRPPPDIACHPANWQNCVKGDKPCLLSLLSINNTWLHHNRVAWNIVRDVRYQTANYLNWFYYLYNILFI